MEKDFDRWNKLKKAINASEESERVYFHEGDIWWVRLGVNVGFEIDGKHNAVRAAGHRPQEVQPVLIPRASPLDCHARQPMAGRDRRRRGQGGVRRPVAAAQPRQPAAYQKIGHVDAELLARIKKTASRMNFG